MNRSPHLFATILLLVASSAYAQASQSLSFDVASVHQNKTGVAPAGDAQDSNVPLGPGNVYAPTGGLLSIRNYPLMNLIYFAWKLTPNQGQTLYDTAPAWAREQRFDVRARTDKADVTKDELRLMMRSLLAERFGLAIHSEARITNVFALQLIKPGLTGPRLRPHPADGCSRNFRTSDPNERGSAPTPSETIAGGYPTVCGGLLMMSSSTPTHFAIGARDVPITVISNAMPSWGDLGRPVVDATGLNGNYDFALDFEPIRPALPAGAQAPADIEEPNFLEAVRKQLGLKLEAQKQEIQVLILDHIDRLSDN